MAAVCTTRLTNVKAIQTHDFIIRKVPGSISMNESFRFTGNKCELTITDMGNCNVKVISSTLNNSPITIYSPGSYHLTFYSFSNSLSLELIPINQNIPSYCYGNIEIVK